MIKLIKSLPEYGKRDIGFVRICCNLAAYGSYDKIALFWAQTDEKGTATALLCLMDGALTVTFDGGDKKELTDFMAFLDIKNIFCEKDTADALGLKYQKVLTVMKCEPPFDIRSAAENTNCGIKYLFDMLKNDFALSEQAFIADISHRLRHNCAFYITTDYSAAVCLYSGNSAMITGICVNKNKRGLGLGSAALARIKAGLRDKTVYAVTDGAAEFYIKNGFIKAGQAVDISR